MHGSPASSHHAAMPMSEREYLLAEDGRMNHSTGLLAGNHIGSPPGGGGGGAAAAAAAVQRCGCGAGFMTSGKQNGTHAAANGYPQNTLAVNAHASSHLAYDDDDCHRRYREPIFSNHQLCVFLSRTLWLCFLMILQSASSFILERYTSLVISHPIITYSLTFLVGAGGNASAQSAVIVVRGLATKQIGRRNEVKLLWREILIGCGMGCVLSVCGFLRIFLFSRDVVAALAIGICLFLIVVTATLIGTVLPLVLLRLGGDPAHSGPAVQVIMDIIGVTVCCLVCTAAFAVFESGAGMFSLQYKK